MKPIDDSEIPMGLGMALMRNKEAMGYFLTLDSDTRQQVIDNTHTIGSKEEMRNYVDSLTAQFH